jgi:hypothetical protein
MEKLHAFAAQKSGEKSGEMNQADAQDNPKDSQLGEKSGEI